MHDICCLLHRLAGTKVLACDILGLLIWEIISIALLYSLQNDNKIDPPPQSACHPNFPWLLVPLIFLDFCFKLYDKSTDLYDLIGRICTHGDIAKHA